MNVRTKIQRQPCRSCEGTGHCQRHLCRDCGGSGARFVPHGYSQTDIEEVRHLVDAMAVVRGAERSVE